MTDANLLLNSEFHFQSITNSRQAGKNAFQNGSIPFWDQEKYGDAEVFRSTKVTAFKPAFPVDGIVVLHPGKSLSQFALLSEMQLGDGDVVSLSVFGYQAKPDSLKATIYQMRLDSAPGTWSPTDFGQTDKRTFPKHARGELIPSVPVSIESGSTNAFELKVENVRIESRGIESKTDSHEGPHTIGLKIVFTNVSDQDVWIYSPSLSQGAAAKNRLPSLRSLPDYYRAIPRTITKLRRGEPLHIIAMGSSIDRASANPANYLYDEDPKSEHFKEPISQTSMLFDGGQIEHPEWTPYIGWWRHFFSYTGRLRQDLMRLYDYPIQKILLNYMACDGSSIGESHSALEEWSTLSHPPGPGLNGHADGKSWQELYPEIFQRPEGIGPDLVIFGSGANEKIDGKEEVAVFEGAIRWFQRHYPNVEFLFCLWNNRESYSPNAGMLKDLALRYGIPLIDIGRTLNLAMRDVNPFALVPGDGHPQAAAHYIWEKELLKAFQVTEPFASGIPQQYLPERLTPVTIGWEGDIRTYDKSSPRIYNQKAFILDDTMVNLWATTKDKLVSVFVDGEENKGSRRKPQTARDPRNSVFATGLLQLGDRHIIEVAGTDAQIVAVDAKKALQRTWMGVASKSWEGIGEVKPFHSQWGAPYGVEQTIINPGQIIKLSFVGTDCSVAWVDDPQGGILTVSIDGKKVWDQPTNQPFTLVSGEKVFLENRRGVMHLPYGVHELEISAKDAPVALLGAFVYDTRANHAAQRSLTGIASSGDTVEFSASFKAPPLVLCDGGLKVESCTSEKVVFGGEGHGYYQVIGE